MGKFKNRSSEIEIMDDLNCSGEVVHKTLHEIEFINRWLGGNTITVSAVKSILMKNKVTGIIRIADLGCGGGGMLREIDDLCRNLSVQCELTGIDANPNIIEYAKTDNADRPNLNFSCHDIFSEDFRQMEFDIILCTLVAHHFSNEQLVSLFPQLNRQSRIATVINDLERDPFAYYSIRWLTTLFSKSEMVKFDAPLSVLRGFKRRELESILKAAGINSFELTWHWAFRWKLIF